MQGLGGVQYPPFGDSLSCSSFGFFGTGINARGQVVGYNFGPDLYMYALLWTSAQGMTRLGGSWPTTAAYGVSNTSQIVGQNSTSGAWPGVATSWTSGVATDLGTLGGGADVPDYISSANGVNDLGQVVGWSITAPLPAPLECFDWWWTGSPPIHAVLWAASGRILDLGTLTGDTFSAAANIKFLRTGYRLFREYVEGWFLWLPSRSHWPSIHLDPAQRNERSKHSNLC